MSALLQDPADLKRLGAEWTAREIAQQPAMWRATQGLLDQQARGLESFLAPLLSLPTARVILTGAGSSAFIGRCLAPALLESTGRRVDAIATTDLISNPRQYLQPDTPTLLVSFARSGNSPESVAALEVCSRTIRNGLHLVITCNAEGALHRLAGARGDARSVLLPPETHDRSFAMTSSFTCMLYAGLVVLGGAPGPARRMPALAAATQELVGNPARFKALAAARHPRVVYLGSATLGGLADEAALKLLELTDGRVVATANTALGFRHGPKAIVDGQTLVCQFLSNDPLTRRYDLDLLAELRRESIAGKVVAISGQAGLEPLSADDVVLPGLADASDIELCLPYAVSGQLYAYHASLQSGISPDNPCASGAVNRVVRGVTIHH